ncbi:MAG: FtsX-like permease family protein [Acidobacteria bacterium]|nr:FtsX-like permease family protein [Acidobacteriota bacterium]
MTEKTYNGFTSGQLLWNNVIARPLRTSLSAAAIALQMVLVLFVVGLTAGVVSEWGKRVEGVGADLLVQPPNSSIFFALSSTVMLQSVGSQIEKLDQVDEVAPVMVVADSRTLDMIYGIDFQRFSALSKGFLFQQGHEFEKPDEVLVDDIKAHTRNLHVGDKVTLLGREFTVAGVVAHGKGARFFIPLSTAQEMAGQEKRVSMFYVRSKGNTEKARQQLVQLLPNHRIRSMAEFLTLMNSSNLPELRPFIRSMVSIGVVISFLVVLLTMHTMVLERTREIGILKSMGATRWDIMGLLLGETLVMTCMGIVVGLVCTFGLQWLLRHTFPTLTVLISAEWILRAIILALAGAMAGAALPAFRASGFDPVDALAYE